MQYSVSPVNCYHAAVGDNSQLVHNDFWSCLVCESVKPCMKPEKASGVQNSTQLSKSGDADMQHHWTTAGA